MSVGWRHKVWMASLVVELLLACSPNSPRWVDGHVSRAFGLSGVTGVVSAGGGPAAAGLFRRMTAAMRAKGSYHVEDYYRAVWPGQEVDVVRGSADVSLAGNQAHSYDSSRVVLLNKSPRVTIRSQEETWQIGKKQLTKEQNGAWGCGDTPEIFTPTYYWDLKLGGMKRIRTTSYGTVGAETVHGVLTWHVVRTWTGVSSGDQVAVSASFYIAQSDHPLVREVWRIHNVAIPAVGGYSWADYSRWGEAVRARFPPARTLPQACRRYVGGKAAFQWWPAARNAGPSRMPSSG